MVQRYIKDIFDGQYKWIEDNTPPPKRAKRRTPGPYIIRDIDPYTSAIDGTVISGRRQHRDHLRAYECEEVGTEKIRAKTPEPLPPVEQDIKQAIEMVQSGYRPRPLDTYKDIEE